MGTSLKENRGIGVTGLQNFISGGIAGVISRSFTSPLNVLKTLFQLQIEPIRYNSKGEYKGIVPALKKIYHEEGLRAFWKGNGVACMVLFPYSAIKFYSYEVIQGVTPFSGVLGSFCAGSTAGLIATMIVYPLDLVKTRLIIQKNNRPKAYQGAWDAMKKIVRNEGGFKRLYSGVSASIVGALPYEGCAFMAYEFLKKFHQGKKREQLSTLTNFTNGCIAASFAQGFAHPFDVARKRLQVQSNAEQMIKPKYNGLIDCFKKIYKHEGLLGFYKGNAVNSLKVVPQAGVGFMVWEHLKKWCQIYNATS